MTLNELHIVSRQVRTVRSCTFSSLFGFVVWLLIAYDVDLRMRGCPLRLDMISNLLTFLTEE